MNKNTGGPAFPHEAHGPNLSTWTEPGMTLRDYFAAKAMQGMQDGGCSCEAIAKASYEMADAMMKEREPK